MRKHGYLLAIVLGVAAITGASIGYSQSTASNRQAWEYMIIEWAKMGDAGLQRLGAQGWELVSVDTELKHEWAHQVFTGGARSFESETYFYFKRPK